MIKRVTARACANIALVKYWGKQPGKENVPATPSISLALDKLKTKTIIERATRGDDRFIINGKPADKASSKRLKEYLNLWRAKKLIDGEFAIQSTNSFPTKAGMASSASGYAALAKGLSLFTAKKISPAVLSQLARIGSGSAARSIPGGLAALPNTKNPAAKLLLPANQIPFGMLICEVTASSKEISSREGMSLSRKTSPYYYAWIKQAETDYRAMLRAIKAMDFVKIGEIAEANMLAMHACMIATRPSLLYWNETTVEILHAVKKWRDAGIPVYATIDAGPHVMLLAMKNDLEKIARRVAKIKGVVKAIKSLPSDGAEIISWN